MNYLYGFTKVDSHDVAVVLTLWYEQGLKSHQNEIKNLIKFCVIDCTWLAGTGTSNGESGKEGKREIWGVGWWKQEQRNLCWQLNDFSNFL